MELTMTQPITIQYILSNVDNKILKTYFLFIQNYYTAVEKGSTYYLSIITEENFIMQILFVVKLIEGICLNAFMMSSTSFFMHEPNLHDIYFHLVIMTSMI